MYDDAVGIAASVRILISPSCAFGRAGSIHLVEGEILARNHEVDAGLEELREAGKRVDAFHYDEPPPWSLAVRYSLGATLVANIATPKPNRFIVTT